MKIITTVSLFLSSALLCAMPIPEDGGHGSHSITQDQYYPPQYLRVGCMELDASEVKSTHPRPSGDTHRPSKQAKVTISKALAKKVKDEGKKSQ